jgi:hypothetical protein
LYLTVKGSLPFFVQGKFMPRDFNGFNFADSCFKQIYGKPQSEVDCLAIAHHSSFSTPSGQLP